MIENIQIGLDLATAVSIIFAVRIFYLQSKESRESRRGQFEEGEKSRRQSEMWGYFKRVADRISEYSFDLANEKIALSRLLEKLPPEEQLDGKDISRVIYETSEFADRIIDRSLKVQAYLQSYTKPGIKNLLKYYEIEGSKKETMLDTIKHADKEIEGYIYQINQIKIIKLKEISWPQEGSEDFERLKEECIKNLAGIIGVLCKTIPPKKGSDAKTILDKFARTLYPSKEGSDSKEVEYIFIGPILDKLCEGILREVAI